MNTRGIILGCALLGALTSNAHAFGEPQPWPNYSGVGWKCSDNAGCLKITNDSTAGATAETIRVISTGGAAIVARSGTATVAGTNAINAQSLHPNQTASTIYAGHDGVGPAFQGNAKDGVGGKFSSLNNDGVQGFAYKSGKASGSFTCTTAGCYGIYAVAPAGSEAGHFDGNVSISGHLYVNGAEVTELLSGPRERYASVFDASGVALAVAFGAAGFTIGYRRRRIS